MENSELTPALRRGTLVSMTDYSLREFRLDLRPALTLAEVSRRTGIAQSTLCKFEGGKREAAYRHVAALATCYSEVLGRPVTFGDVAQMLAIGAGIILKGEQAHGNQVDLD